MRYRISSLLLSWMSVTIGACSAGISPGASQLSTMAPVLPPQATATPVLASPRPTPLAACESLMTGEIEPPAPVEAVLPAETLDLVAEISVPDETLFLTFGGGWLWAAGSGSIWRIDPTTDEVTLTVETDSSEPPDWPAFGENSLWIARKDAGTLLRYDLQTGDLQAEIALEASDRPMTIAVGAGSVWVANQTTGTVSRIDPTTDGIRQKFDLRAAGPIDPGPSGVVVLGDALWVSEHRAGSLARIDTVTGEVSRTCLGVPTPGRITATADAVWAIEIGGLVNRVDPVSGGVVKRVEIGGPIGEVAADGATVWVANGSYVISLSAPDGEVLDAAELPAQSEARAFPGGLAIAVGPEFVWTTDPSGDGILKLRRND